MLNAIRLMIGEGKKSHYLLWMKLLVCFPRRKVFSVLKAILLSTLLLAGGCGSVAVYQPDPRIKPSMMAMEAERTIQETIMQTGIYKQCSNVQVTTDGFSYLDEYPDGSQQRSYNFRSLPTLVVLYDRLHFWYKVNLGDDFIYWLTAENPKKFVDAINAINYYSSSKLIDDDVEAFTEFTEKAKAWRALPQKPDIPEEARRYKVLAEDAFRNKNYDAAVGNYEKGLEVCSFWPDGHFNAALLCGETGMYAKAICHMKRYLELYPDAKDAQAARDKMYIWEGKLD